MISLKKSEYIRTRTLKYMDILNSDKAIYKQKLILNNTYINTKHLFNFKLNEYDYQYAIMDNYRYLISPINYTIDYDNIFKQLDNKNFINGSYLFEKMNIFTIYKKYIEHITMISSFLKEKNEILIFPYTDIKLNFKNLTYDLKINKIEFKNNNNVDDLYNYTYDCDFVKILKKDNIDFNNLYYDQYNFNALFTNDAYHFYNLNFTSIFNYENLVKFMQLITYSLIKRSSNKIFILKYSNINNYVNFIYKIITNIFENKYVYILNTKNLLNIKLNKNIYILDDTYINDITLNDINMIKNIMDKDINVVIFNNKIIDNIILEEAITIDIFNALHNINYNKQDIKIYSNILIKKCLEYYKFNKIIDF